MMCNFVSPADQIESEARTALVSPEAPTFSVFGSEPHRHG